MSAENFDMTVADAAFEPPPAPAPASRRPAVTLKSGNAALAVLFAAGIVAVYGLSFRKGPAKASADQLRVEQQVTSALTRLSGPVSGGLARASDVASCFYYEAAQRQVPLDKLPGNPFVFSAPNQVLSPAAAESAQPAPKSVEHEALTQAMEAAGRLSLQSVLMGRSGNTAVISNNILTEGQVIDGWTVSKIEPRQVVLTWRDQTHVLEMP